MNEKPRIVRSPEPKVRTAPVAEEFRRVAELVLGHALEGRDRWAEFGMAERAKGSPAQAGQTAWVFSQMSGEVLKLTGRAIYVARDAYRGAVAQMHRLTGREDADTAADARETFEERALAEDAPLKAEEAARKATEGKPKADAKEQAERAEAGLAQERVRNEELARQLAARADEQKLLVQERARTQELARQLAAHADEQKLLVQERARTQELARQLAAHADEQKLLVQERARTQELEQQLTARADEQKLLVQERVRTQEQQLAARADEQKLLARERARTQELEQQLAARSDEQKLLARERARTQELEQQLAARADERQLL